jgi:hypothetical protein
MKKSQPIAIRFDEDVKEMIDKFANRERLPFTTAVNQICAKFLESKSPLPKNRIDPNDFLARIANRHRKNPIPPVTTEFIEEAINESRE